MTIQTKLKLQKVLFFAQFGFIALITRYSDMRTLNACLTDHAQFIDITNLLCASVFAK